MELVLDMAEALAIHPDRTTGVDRLEHEIDALVAPGPLLQVQRSVPPPGGAAHPLLRGFAVADIGIPDHPGSTQRIVNGTSQGSETATGTNRDGKTFSSVRTSADTTTGLVIPVSATAQTYPTAGTVTRRMKVIMTISGTSSTKERREVLTYDGSATAKLQITDNGTTKNCNVALPRGRPNCS
jgi:hypothetical protein